MGNSHPRKPMLNEAKPRLTLVFEAIFHVATFHHVLGRDFMIQGVILTFFKCLSANQNQLFYMKV